ncbi:MAG: aspartyl protease family protein [Mariniblastus sp.]
MNRRNLRYDIVILLLVATLGSSMCLAVQESQESKTADTDSVENADNVLNKVAFEISDANNISVPAMLNGVDEVRLMFHTANSEVVLTAAAAAKSESVKFEKSISMSSWGGKTEGKISESNSLRIGSQQWDNIRIFQDQLSGPGTDGKFGPDRFEGNVFEIDVDANTLRVYSSLPEKVNQYEKLAVTNENGMMFIVGSIKVAGQWCENKFLIHSGYGGSVLLDDEFVESHGLKSKLKTLSESELRDSGGNVLKTKKIELPMLKVGSFELQNVPTQVFDGSIRKQKMSVVGGDFLKRFNIVFDSKNSCIYLKRSELFEAEFKK